MSDDDFFKLFYPDLDGNGRIDRSDEDVFLIEKQRRHKEEERLRLEEEDEEDFDEFYDEDGEDDDVDDDDEAVDDEDEETSSQNSPSYESEEDADDDVESYRQRFIRNVKKHPEFVSSEKGLCLFETGEQHEGNTVPLRYLLKDPYIPKDVLDVKRALFEKFPEVKDSFDFEDDEPAATIIVKFLKYDTAKGLQMWEFLLKTFHFQLLEGLPDCKEVLIDDVLDDIILRHIQDVQKLSNFFADKFVREFFFEHHTWRKNDSDFLDVVLGCLVQTNKFELAIQLFAEAERGNGGFTKKTLESILFNMIYEINSQVPESFKNFIAQKAKTLGIREKEIMRTFKKTLLDLDE